MRVMDVSHLNLLQQYINFIDGSNQTVHWIQPIKLNFDFKSYQFKKLNDLDEKLYEWL